MVMIIVGKSMQTVALNAKGSNWRTNCSSIYPSQIHNEKNSK